MMNKKWTVPLACAVGIALIGIQLSACSRLSKNNVALTADTVNKQASDSREVIHINDAIESVPKIIKEEDSRFVDQNHILHINILNSQTISGAQKRLLTQLFPGASIEYIDSGESFDAFNIEYKGEKYNAVFSFDQQEKVSILDVIFITRGAFDIDKIESLFN